jgi:hypothetical protein
MKRKGHIQPDASQVMPNCTQRSLFVEGGRQMDTKITEARMWATNGKMAIDGTAANPVVGKANMLFVAVAPEDASVKLYETIRAQMAKIIRLNQPNVSPATAEKIDPPTDFESLDVWEGERKRFAKIRVTTWAKMLNKACFWYYMAFKQKMFKPKDIGMGVVGYGFADEDAGVWSVKARPGLTMTYQDRKCDFVLDEDPWDDRPLSNQAMYVGVRAASMRASSKGEMDLSWQDWCALATTQLWANGKIGDQDGDKPPRTSKDIGELIWQHIGIGMCKAYERVGPGSDWVWLLDQIIMAIAMIRAPVKIHPLSLWSRAKSSASLCRDELEQSLQTPAKYPGMGSMNDPFLPMYRNKTKDLLYWPVCIDLYDDTKKASRLEHESKAKAQPTNVAVIEVKDNKATTSIDVPVDTVRWVRFKDKPDTTMEMVEHEDYDYYKLTVPNNDDEGGLGGGDDCSYFDWVCATLANGESFLADGYVLTTALQTPYIERGHVTEIIETPDRFVEEQTVHEIGREGSPDVVEGVPTPGLVVRAKKGKTKETIKPPKKDQVDMKVAASAGESDTSTSEGS